MAATRLVFWPCGWAVRRRQRKGQPDGSDDHRVPQNARPATPPHCHLPPGWGATVRHPGGRDARFESGTYWDTCDLPRILCRTTIFEESVERRVVPLRSQPREIAREKGDLADVLSSNNAGHPALESDGKATVRWHPMSKGGEIAVERSKIYTR
jgi:hypothetical protein